MKYFIKTFGCQMNYSDSERIASALEKIGYEEASKIMEADLVVFNSCSVRQSAEDRVVGQIRNLARDSKIKIALTGCMSHYHKKRIDEWMKRVDYFFPIGELAQFVKCLNENIKNQENDSGSMSGMTLQKRLDGDYLKVAPKYRTQFTAYVPIMTGCNNYCSYCIVPYARGRERSRPMTDVLAEVKKLIDKGFKEIILVGQNVNSYRPSFVKLLTKVNSIPGNFWLRFLTSHPKDMSDDLIKAMPKFEKLCEQLNLPFQSGDDKILKLMNRKYNAKQYLKLLNKIRKYNPGYLFSTDIIVGFPSETKQQFENTAKLLKAGDFDMAYINQYSPRPKTAAAKMLDSVTKNEKEKREKILEVILKKNIKKHNSRLIGKTIDVLVEFKSKDYYVGVSRQLKKIRFKHSKNLVGQFVKVKIIKSLNWGLEGAIISD